MIPPDIDVHPAAVREARKAYRWYLRRSQVKLVGVERKEMELRFWIDPETDLPHVFNHGVIEEEVREVLNRTGEEFPGSDRSRIRLGQTAAGRYLQVVYVPDEIGDGAFVVTAFDMTPKARRAFRRRRRRNNK